MPRKARVLVPHCPHHIVQHSSVSYKGYKDYASLEAIYKNLFKGMNRKEIIQLLGKADYSPIEGQYYYSSERSEYSASQEREITVGLVVDFRDSNGSLTENLQAFWLGTIAE